MTIHQQRVSLKNLKVADFASEETLCFTATVLFDGEPVADADNDGHGGSTVVRVRDGKQSKLAEAEQFAASLSPEVIRYDDPRDSSHNFTVQITLDYLVDELANTMHADKKIRAAFNRDIGNKVLFVKDGKLLFLKGIKLKAIADRKAYFTSLHARQTQPIVVLAELPPEQAFDLWKQHVLGNKQPD